MKLFLRDKIIWILLAGFCISAWAYRPYRAVSQKSFSLNKKLKTPDENEFLLYHQGKKKQGIYFTTYVNGYLQRVNYLPLDRITTSWRWKPPITVNRKAESVQAFRVQGKERSEAGYYTFFSVGGDLKKVCLYINPEDFFDFNTGIYITGITGTEVHPLNLRETWWDRPANYHQRGKKWDRPVYFQYYDETGNLRCEISAQMRINGNATRAYPQKSLRIKFDKKIKSKLFSNGIFPDKTESVILRNSGNDWDRTFFADVLAHDLALQSSTDEEDLILGQTYEPVAVYVNGVYWGLHNMRPKLDEVFLADYYQVKKKKIAVLEGDQLNYGDEKSVKDFREITAWLKKTNLNDEQKLFELKSKINYKNFVHYLAIQLYCANTDWPKNNLKCFRIEEKSVAVSVQKWNWLMWDMDYAFAFTGATAVQTDMFAHIQKSSSYLSDWLQSLLKCNAFRTDLRANLEHLMQLEILNNTGLDNYLSHFANRIKTEMPEQIHRWRKPESMSAWQENTEHQKEFFLKRKAVVEQQIENYLEVD